MLVSFSLRLGSIIIFIFNLTSRKCVCLFGLRCLNSNQTTALLIEHYSISPHVAVVVVVVVVRIPVAVAVAPYSISQHEVAPVVAVAAMLSCVVVGPCSLSHHVIVAVPNFRSIVVVAVVAVADRGSCSSSVPASSSEYFGSTVSSDVVDVDRRRR